MHRAAAAAIAGIPVEQVTAEQRKAAKAIVFGTVYGSGAGGIRATAWANFDVDLTLEQAGAAREAFLSRYAGVRAYQQRQADHRGCRRRRAQRARPTAAALNGKAAGSGTRRP